MSETVRVNLIWAAAAVFVAGMIATIVIVTNRQNRELEDQMRIGGYEQGSIPGQNGVYWVKVREEWR